MGNFNAESMFMPRTNLQSPVATWQPYLWTPALITHGYSKPVYLKLELLTNTGTVCCCPANRGASLGITFCLNGLSRSPVLDTLTLPRLASYVHEPYTPESMDTPSPIPSPIPGDMRELQKSFNDSVTARLRQRAENIQGDQGPLIQRIQEEDWTHCQSSDLGDTESSLDNNYSDYNANSREEVRDAFKQSANHQEVLYPCDNLNDLKTFDGLDNKTLLQSPKVLVTQFAQKNNDSPGLECYLIESLETERCNEPLLENIEPELNVREVTDKAEIPPSHVPSDSGNMELQSKSKEDKKIRNINNRVCSQETLVESVKDLTSGKAKKPKTFVKCLQSQSAVEMKVSRLDNMDAMNQNDSALELDSPTLGMRTSRCFSDASWLQRSTVNKPLSRVRLLSGCNSLTRLQSHHSSSDEDWFEEVNEPETFHNDINVSKTKKTGDSSQNDINSTVPIMGLLVDQLENIVDRPKDLNKKDVQILSPTTTNCSSGSNEIADMCALLHIESSIAQDIDISPSAKVDDMSTDDNASSLTDIPYIHSPKESIEVVRLYKKQSSENLNQVSTLSVSQPCGDTSIASLMAYIKEQSEVLARESQTSDSCEMDPIEEEKKESNKSCVSCCTIL